ncbi:MAG TPA: TniQ family protein [Burkholderiaceae bacterium]
MVVLQSRMFHKSRRAAEIEIYGRVKVTPNLFGIDAQAVATRLFGDALSAEDVLDRHSLFGFYRYFLDEVRESQLAERLAAGDVRAWHDFLPSRGQVDVSVGGFRCCTECIREDRDREGYAVWYTWHQLSFLSICPKHGCSLVCRCDRCGAVLQQGLSTWLPGDPCRRCGALPESKPVDCSDGELLLTALCARICSSGDSLFRPRAWSAFVQRAVEEVGDLDLAALVFEDAIARQWEVESISDLAKDAGRLQSAPELAKLAGRLHPDFVRRELQSLSDIGNVFGRLVLRNAIEEVLGQTDFARLVLQAVGVTRTGSMALAEQLAAEAGVPLGAVRLLARGWNIRAVCDVANICDALLRRFVVGLVQRDLRSENAPAGSLEVIESITGSVTDLKRKQRMAARAAIAAALAEGRKIPRTWADPLGRQACWLRKHDGQWLREQLPFQSELKQSRDAAKKEQFRAEVLAFKQAKPEAVLDDASRRSWEAARWLYAYDRDWFNEQFPSRYRLKYRNEGHKKEAFRTTVREFVRAHPGVTRSGMKKLGGPWNYLVTHDKAWTMKLVPPSINTPAAQTTRA